MKTTTTVSGLSLAIAAAALFPVSYTHLDVYKRQGLVVIAEGVEQAGSLEILQGLHCDMVQGYFFSKPVDADGFRRWHDEFEAAAARAPDPSEATA